MPQEDVNSPKLPPLVSLLYELQMMGYSTHRDILLDELRVIPVPDDRLTELVKEHYDELLYLQPGVCDQCQQWHIRRHDAYWGATPLYCGLCLLRLIKAFEKQGVWPDPHLEVPTSDRENNEANPTQAQDTTEPGK